MVILEMCESSNNIFSENILTIKDSIRISLSEFMSLHDEIKETKDHDKIKLLKEKKKAYEKSVDNLISTLKLADNKHYFDDNDSIFFYFTRILYDVLEDLNFPIDDNEYLDIDKLEEYIKK
jgi:hypothetical protein